MFINRHKKSNDLNFQSTLLINILHRLLTSWTIDLHVSASHNLMISYGSQIYSIICLLIFHINRNNIILFYQFLFLAVSQYY
jgi:hypothetical protein